MLEKISFRPTESERLFLEEQYQRSGAKTVTEFWRILLQDWMIQKGGSNAHQPHSPTEMIPARGDRVQQFHDSSNMAALTHMLLQAQREHYERQLQGMLVENQNLRNDVAYLRQQLQYSAMPYGPNGMSPFQQQMPQQNYMPWGFNQASYSYPYNLQPQYHQAEPPAKDAMDIWIEGIEKMNRWRSAMNGNRNLV